ncbi:MAG TPA: DUF1571 domain-containing protein [Bacteroidetes bacterium]|nr:DUF1571 domain-containing protein [Bacteroidota bacterium]
MMNIYLLLLFLIPFHSNIVRADEPVELPAAEVMDRVIDRIERSYAVELYMSSAFREGKEMRTRKGFLRMKKDPLQIYFRQDHPDEGVELLYREGSNANKVLVWPNDFPWVNLKLDPQGSLIRKNSNHSIFDAGYWYLGDMIGHILRTGAGNPVLRNEGPAGAGGQHLLKLTMELPGFGFEDYTVQEGEDLISIATRLKVPEYMILQRNPGIDHLWDVEPGQTIRVPTCYASRMVLLIDTRLMLPVKIDIYDDRGLFESYSYRNIRLDPGFTEQTFSADNPEYGF